MPLNAPGQKPPLEWHQALDLILSHARALPPEQVALGEAWDHVCAKDIRSEIDVPPFDNSSMDGFAVRAEDVAGASSAEPVELEIIGTAAAGAPFEGDLRMGTAVEIMTGAPICAGCDAVIRVEAVKRAGNRVQISEPVRVGNYIRRGGGDTARGALLCETGTRLGAPEIGLLASCGIPSASVVRKPRIAAVSTGDELVSPGRQQLLAPGQIFESNMPMLMALFRSWRFPFRDSLQTGENPEAFDRVPDNLEATAKMLERALESDVVLTVGGVSMGSRDFVRPALEQLGCDQVFWRVNQQPGGPVGFYMRGEKLIFALPGNPVSCYFCCELYVLPALRMLAGWRETEARRTIFGVKAKEKLTKVHGKTSFLRARLDEEMRATQTGAQDSNLIRSLVGSDGYIIFPADKREISAGENIEFLLTNEPRIAELNSQMSGDSCWT